MGPPAFGEWRADCLFRSIIAQGDDCRVPVLGVRHLGKSCPGEIDGPSPRKGSDLDRLLADPLCVAPAAARRAAEKEGLMRPRVGPLVGLTATGSEPRPTSWCVDRAP